MVTSNMNYAALVSESKELVKDLPQEFARIVDFLEQLAIAFGNDFNRDIVNDLQAQMLGGAFEVPRIEVRSQTDWTKKLLMKH